MYGKVLFNSEIVSLDGPQSALSGVGFNTQVRYFYIDMLREGYNCANVQFLGQGLSVTVEATNSRNDFGEVIKGQATSTTVAGDRIVDSTLTSRISATDNDLNQAYIKIVSDVANPSNVGQQREIVFYVGSSGTCFVNQSPYGSSFPAQITSGVTQYEIIDSPVGFQRRVSDPIVARWQDVTELYLGVPSFVVPSVAVDKYLLSFKDILDERLRIVFTATSASNNLSGIRLTRSRQ